MQLRRKDATAWQQMEGFRPLHDEQEGRFRTTSLHPPAAPNDHHHQDLANVLPSCGVATMCHPWPIVAFVAVQATQPLRPAGRALAYRCAHGDRGVGQSHVLLAIARFSRTACWTSTLIRYKNQPHGTNRRRSPLRESERAR